MVSKDEKRRMQDFVAGVIEGSGFKIKKSNMKHLLVHFDSERGFDIHVALHNEKMTIDDYNRLINENYYNGILTSNVFYKDGKNFMVRLGERGHIKGDERSLKNYSKEERDRIIHLRGLEKRVLECQGFELLLYYQPETERITECLRGYKMLPVRLDYSHVDKSHRSHGFVFDRDSLDYKIAEERFNIRDEEKAKFGLKRGNTCCVIYPRGELHKKISYNQLGLFS